MEEEKSKDQLILFGARPVMEAIDAEKQIDRVYIKKGSDSPLVLRVMEMCREYNVNFQEVPIEKLNRLTRGNHQGIVAQMSPIEYYDITNVLEDVAKSGETPLIVVMDSVTDVRNFGAIARSAECAGAHAIIMSLKNSAPVNGEAIRSSAGALTIIPVCRVGSIKLILKTLADMGMQIVSATEKAETVVYDADLTKPTVLVMGSEDKGISKDILKMSD
ncbi:MAG: 23S rRNA (guanosine(2251)-2'-O)-methyltransferase RlmB, partial [Rikenellaceae bacterium]